MDHEPWIEAIGALHDGELSAGDKTAALAHLKDCEPCRRAYERWGKISRVFFSPRPKPTATQTDFFVRRVIQRLENPRAADERPILWSMRWAIPALGLGAAVLFFSVLWPGPESIAPADVLFLVNPQNSAEADYVFGFSLEE